MDNKIKDIMKDKWLTQKELSKETGISYETLTKILGNKVSNPSIETIKKIAACLNVPYVNLLNSNDENKPIITHWYLPFHSLWEDRFRALIHAYILKMWREEIQDVDWTWDRWIDLYWKKNKEKYLFQIKCYKKLSLTDIKPEIDKIKENNLIENDQISRIIFCVSCWVTWKTRNDAQKYSLAHLWKSVEFRTERELDSMINTQAQELIARFFNWSHQEILEKQIEMKNNLQKMITKQWNTQKAVDEAFKMLKTINNNQEISDEETEHIRDMINADNYNEWYEKAYEKYAFLKNKQSYDKKSGIYANMVWVALLKKWNIEDSIKYFIEASSFKEVKNKANFNHARALFLLYEKGSKENIFDKCISLLNEILDNSIDTEKFYSDFLALYLTCLLKLNKTKELKEFIEKPLFNKDNIKEYSSAVFFHTLCVAYNLLNMPEKSEEVLEVWLEKIPLSWLLLQTKWDLYLEKLDKIYNDWDVIFHPKFIDELYVILNLYEKSIDNNKNEEVKAKIILIKRIISLSEGKRYDEINKNMNFNEVNLDKVSDMWKKNIKLAKLESYLYECKFDLAFQIIELELDNLNDEEKYRLAHIFMKHWSPENSVILIEQIELKDNLEYRCFLSSLYSLIWDLVQTNKIIENWLRTLKNNIDKYNKFLEFTSIILSKFKKDEERLIKKLIEIDENIPENKIVQRFDTSDKIPKEVLEIIKDSKIQYDKTKDIFLKNPIPIYMLKNIYKKTTNELFSFWYDNCDFNFTIKWFANDDQSLQILRDNFRKKNKIIFDYFSLYNIANGGMLWSLKDLGKEMFIHIDLFNQIQDDLLNTENEILRKLWDFIRVWNIKKIETKIEEVVDEEAKNIKTFFWEWISSSIMFTKKYKDYLFITDDFNTSSYCSWKNIDCCNSYIIMNILLEYGSIDKSFYADYLYAIWKSLITFIRFDHQDIFNIYLKDCQDLSRKDRIIYWKYLTSWSFFHLINQMQLPSSNHQSFINVFWWFILKIIKSGLLFKDKLDAIILISIQIWILYEKINKEVCEKFSKNTQEHTTYEDIKEDIKNIMQAEFGNAIKVFTSWWKLLSEEAKWDEINNVINELKYLSEQKDQLWEKNNFSNIYSDMITYINIKEKNPIE